MHHHVKLQFKKVKTSCFRGKILADHYDDGVSLIKSLENNSVELWPGFFHQGERTGERVYKVSGTIHPKRNYSIKVYPPPKGPHIPCVSLVRYKTRHSFKVSQFLCDHDIGTPKPVMIGLFTAGPNVNCSIFMTEWLENFEPLGPYSDIFFQQEQTHEWVRMKRMIAVQLGRFVRKLHQRGIYHGDFNSNNLLIDHSVPPQIVIIDTGDVRSLRWISHRRILKNLDEVNRFFLNTGVVSRSDRLRFLKEYLGPEKLSLTSYYWKKVKLRTEKRLIIHNKSFIRQ